MTNDEIRHALWRESVGLDAPGTHKIRRFATFEEFLDDQVEHVVSWNSGFPHQGNSAVAETLRLLPAWAQVTVEQLRDEL